MLAPAPDRDRFTALYEAGKPQLCWTRLVADLDTPVSAYLKLTGGAGPAFLLESVEGGATLGRWSFIGWAPDLLWRCRDLKPEINRDPAAGPEGFLPVPGDALDSLRALLAESRIDLPAGMPPMAAGLVGYLSYDTVRWVEDIPAGNPDTIGVPDALLMRPTIIAVFDNIQRALTVVTPVRPSAELSADDAWEAAQARLARAAADFDQPLDAAHEYRAPRPLSEPRSNTTREEYHRMVAAAKEYILAGDIFQVVPSHRFTLDFDLPAFSLYRALRRLNPSPFLFHLDFGGFQVVGSSPEILVRQRDGTVTIRPIAGTRPRGADAAQDQALAAELLADPKERAEHLMLLDLGRNDVGRVAEIGSVRVTEQFVIERYSHVMHIVSNVEGKVRPGLDALDALYAGFPAGTVSGAPKVRAMQIIDELEKAKRGIYAGCVGYFGADGDMDTCIALRTGVVKDGKLYVQAGGGVVADSDPEAEWQETCNKARALLRAAEEAARIG